MLCTAEQPTMRSVAKGVTKWGVPPLCVHRVHATPEGEASPRNSNSCPSVSFSECVMPSRGSTKGGHCSVVSAHRRNLGLGFSSPLPAAQDPQGKTKFVLAPIPRTNRGPRFARWERKTQGPVWVPKKDSLQAILPPGSDRLDLGPARLSIHTWIMALPLG